MEGQMWAETWIRRIEALGLAPVVLLLLEATHAFGFLGSQALLMAQPLVTGIVSDATLERTMTLLNSPDLLDQVRARLERGES